MVFRKIAQQHFTPFNIYSLDLTVGNGQYDSYSFTAPTSFYYAVGGYDGNHVDSRYLKQIRGPVMSNAGVIVTLTVNAVSKPTGRESYSADSVYYDSVYFNVNDAQHLALRSGDLFNLLPIRVWQAQQGVVGNFFIEPEYFVEVLSDDDAITCSPEGSEGLEYFALTGVTPGVSVLRFTYDPVEWGKRPESARITADGEYNLDTVVGPGALTKDFFNAIAPVDTGIVVVTVDENETARQRREKITTNIAQREYDTIYFDRAKTDHATYTFTPTHTDNAPLSVRVHKPIHEGTGVVWGGGWNDAAKNGDGSFTVTLYEGRNVVEVAAAGTAKYHVIHVRGVTINIVNTTNPGSAFRPGDTAEISFHGLQLQLAKIAGIYNPGYPRTNFVRYTNAATNETVQSAGTQYAIGNPEHNKLTVTLSEGETRLVNGCMPTGYIGSPLDSHRIQVGNSVGANLNGASGGGSFCTLPDIVLTAAAAPSTSGGGGGGGGGTTPEEPITPIPDPEAPPAEPAPVTPAPGPDETVKEPPAVVVPLKPEYIKVDEDTGGKTVTLPEGTLTEMLAEAIDKAKEENSNEPTLRIGDKATTEEPAAESVAVREVKVEIPIGDLKAVVDSAVENVQIVSEVGEIMLNTGSLKDLIDRAEAEKEEGEDIPTVDFVVTKGEETLTVEEKLSDEQKTTLKETLKDDNVRDVFDVSVYVKQKLIEDFKTPAGKLTIGLPYSLKPAEVKEGVKVFHIRKEGGDPEEMIDRWYDVNKELAVFQTNHLSVYAVVYDADAKAEDDGGGTGKRGGGCDAGAAGWVILSLGIALAVRKASRRNR